MEIKIRINDRLVGGVKKVFNRRVLPFLLAVVLLGVTVGLLAEPFVIPFVFKSGEVISSSQMNSNFSGVETRINAIQTQVDSLVASGGAVWSTSAPHIYYNGGNVGIGTGIPSSLLHLYNNGDVGIKVESVNESYPPYVTLGMSGNYGVKLWRHTTDHSLNFDTGGSTSMTLDTAGTLSVARIEDTASSSYYVDPASTTKLSGLITRGWITSGESGSAGKIRVLDSSGAVEAFAATGAGDMVVSRNVAIGGTTVIGGNTLIGLPEANAGLNVWGTVGAYFYATLSDARLKKNIAPLQGSLSKLAQLQGVSYEWNSAESGRQESPARQIGLVAQDVEAVFPELVMETDQGYLALSYNGLTALLLEAVKELKEENDLLKERVAALEAR